MKVSVVVPTFNEGSNPALVAEALHRALEPMEFEVVFVDDSSDSASVAQLERLSLAHPWVRFEHRVNERGLGTAVVRGFELAQGDLIAVMDADMQHPPEVLRAMIPEVIAGADIVIPSRFVPGGDDGGLSSFRKLVSGVARVIGQAMLHRVRTVTDPTSGFFLFRRSVVEGVKLQPIGWKILMEVLVRGNYESIREIPYRFQPRVAGSSNMSLKEQWNYLRHVARLVSASPEDRRKYVFAAVGISGVLVNMVIYYTLVRLGLALWAAAALSGAVAMLNNFLLNDNVTWRDSRNVPAFSRLFRYVATSLAGIGINVAVLAVIDDKLGSHFLIANLIGIGAAMVWNFYANNFWTWRARRKAVVISVAAARAESVERL